MDKRQQVMELWRRCFADPDEFIRFYFERKYSDANTLVHEENSKVLSALQMLPYPMRWENVMVNTSYISGACTLPEARNRGFMTLLLRNALQEMYDRGIAFSTLIPAEDWLFGYYANQGYVTVFDYTLHTYTPENHSLPNNLPSMTSDRFDENFAQNLFPYFEQEMSKRNYCIQHPYNDYITIVEEAYLSEGRLWAIYRQNAPAGWALAVPEKDTVCIKELLFDTEQEKTELLQNIHAHWPDKTLVYKTPPATSGNTSLGMARLTHAPQMLQYFAQTHPETAFTLKLNDPQVPSNNGIYIIAGGNSTQTDKISGPIDGETDIPVLTKALLGYHTDLPAPLNGLFREARPYMSLMLD